MRCLVWLGLLSTLGCAATTNETSTHFAGPTELCLEGRYDIGVRYQGLDPEPGQWVDARWCVVSEPGTDRVVYSAQGRVNHDYDNSWAVAYEPPELVRLINRDSPPDVEFRGADHRAGAMRIRRLDPRRLREELTEAGAIEGLDVSLDGDRVQRVDATVDMPLRGTVAVSWSWDWTNETEPSFVLEVDGERLMEGRASWRELSAEELAARFARTEGADPIEAPGNQWPTSFRTQLIEHAPGISMARGVRRGFQHFVVDTDDGLVVVDALAGWVEFHHLPPADLAPGLGVSGLSENLVDYLAEQFPDRPIAAVVLTHLHDDHAGGARAFAAAGGRVFAPAPHADFIQSALRRDNLPVDRLAEAEGSVTVEPVDGPLVLGASGSGNQATLLPMGSNPHVSQMLGVLATNSDGREAFFVSDVHVPRSDAEAPDPASGETDCWFAEWATTHLSPATEVINSHSPVITPVSRLEKWLESEVCAQAR